MKYLAILKDSLREVIDGKVFYVMLAFSLAVALLLFTVGYKSMTPEGELESYASFWNWRARMLDRGAGSAMPALGVEIKDFRATREAPSGEPWKGAYAFTWIVHCRDEAQAKKVREAQFTWMGLHDPNKATEEQLVFILLQARAGSWLKDMQLNPVPAEDPKLAVFAVTSSGTRMTSLSGWIHEPSLFFGAVPISFAHAPKNSLVFFFMNNLVGSLGAAVAMLIGTVITAAFIPNMLRKGAVDLLLVKPVNRPLLLAYKYVGGLSFMFLVTTATIVFVWLALGLRSGVWSVGFLLAVLVLTFQFAVYYACSVLFGVWTRSPIVAILMTCLLWALLTTVGWLHGTFHPQPGPSESGVNVQADAGPSTTPSWAVAAVDGLHAVLPRMDELNALRGEMISWDVQPQPDEDAPRPTPERSPWRRWVEPVAVSLAFIVVLLGAACWMFSRRDY
jgi:ABC-type transport system involved in multi-copper enzyme maturation permease subunit